jgi:hypothetical protein
MMETKGRRSASSSDAWRRVGEKGREGGRGMDEWGIARRATKGWGGKMEEAVVRTQDGEYRDGGDGSDRKEMMANFVTFMYITMGSRSFTKK